MIDICCTADLHGIFPVIEKPFDLLLLAGDIVSLDCQSNIDATYNWYAVHFTNWLKTLPYKDSDSKVILIAGNHEVGWQKMNGVVKINLLDRINIDIDDRLIYLEDTYFKFKGIKIFGTPYCKLFGRWAYTVNNESLIAHYDKCPENCDILLTHDAPYGVSDVCYDWEKFGYALEHIGNVPLRDMILKKKPKYCIHGHLHSSNHNEEILGSTKVYCVSLLNEDYKEVYEPLYLKL